MPREQSKKRKRSVVLHHESDAPNAAAAPLDTSKPTAIFKPSKGRSYTLSIAVPGNVIANCQTHDLKSALAGTIARAAAVFCVDEIVVFDDGQSPNAHRGHLHHPTNGHPQPPADEPVSTAHTGWTDPCAFLVRLLTYLETPPHLRRALFPLHADLRGAGALPSLDMPHHPRAGEWCAYREGVTLPPDTRGVGDSQPWKKKARVPAPAAEAEETLVDAGLPHPVRVPAAIPPHTRVTLSFTSHASASSPPPSLATESLRAAAVAPWTPREEAGFYWGYTVRRAASLSRVITECEFAGGYDFCVGTSERGRAVGELSCPVEDGGVAVPLRWKRLLLVFGGVAGLESAAEADPELRERGVGSKDVGSLFDAWVNLVPGQGSRTIRTEEAVWVGLMGLRGLAEKRALVEE